MESERFIYWGCGGYVRDTITRDFTVQFASVLFYKPQSEVMGQILQKIIFKKYNKQSITAYFGNCQETLFAMTIHSESKAEKPKRQVGMSVCYMIFTMPLKIKISYIIGLEWQ